MEARAALVELAKARRFDARVFGSHISMRLLCVVAFGANERLSDDLGITLPDLIRKVFGIDVPASDQAAASERLACARQSLDRLVKNVRERTQDSDAARALSELQLSVKDLANENLMFLIVGHDTTGAATAWLCHILATVPGLSDLIAAKAVMVAGSKWGYRFCKTWLSQNNDCYRTRGPQAVPIGLLVSARYTKECRVCWKKAAKRHGGFRVPVALPSLCSFLGRPERVSIG